MLYSDQEKLFFGKGLYFTYDMAHRDAEGDYRIIGRVDDVTAIKGVWLDVAGIEDTMVRILTLVVYVFKLYYRFFFIKSFAQNMSDPRVLETFIVTINQGGSDKVERKFILMHS